MMSDKPSIKFEIIRETLKQADNVLHIKTLCEIAGVSRAGYHKCLRAEPKRKEREQKDQNDFALVLKAYQHRGYNKGARSIHMQLLHQQPPIVMNVKKIRRLMEKYNLFCPIRKANPYRSMMRAMRTSHVSQNLLDRNFTTMGPHMVLLTGVTRIPAYVGETQRQLAGLFDHALNMDTGTKAMTQRMAQYDRLYEQTRRREAPPQPFQFECQPLNF